MDDKEMPFTPTLIYCYDAYCGWCYGFSPVIRDIAKHYEGRLYVETLSGGMIPKETRAPIAKSAEYILSAYERVESLTSVKFGADYLWHLRNPELSDWFPDSEKPAIAMAIFREYQPDRTVEFAADIQYGLYYEGRDLTDNEAYRHLLGKYEIPEDEFYQKIADPAYQEKALYDFSLVKQLQVNGFPAVLLQTDELKFYLVSRGYTDFDTIKQRIDSILEEHSKTIPEKDA